MSLHKTISDCVEDDPERARIMMLSALKDPSTPLAYRCDYEYFMAMITDDTKLHVDNALLLLQDMERQYNQASVC